MRVMLMTDLEGVAGVKDFDAWCTPESRNYPAACQLLTREANAAVEGFFAGGATYVQVADGHGYGGIDVELLNPRVEYARGWPEGFPFHLDETFDGIAWVGQHAKASTEFAHLPHTQGFHYLDLSVNGVSIGEFGQLALCASELAVCAFFAAGDLAFTAEAEALVPGITTCTVKRGVTPGTGEECGAEAYRLRNQGAIHMPPARAREAIRQSAQAAMTELAHNPPPLIPLQTPFERVTVLRPEVAGASPLVSRESHPSSVVALMNLPLDSGAG